VRAVAIGNGTASRETDAFIRDFLRERQIQGIFSVTVSESGASVYSVSEIARQEFPDLDLTVRGAISIARRLQDPLSELVKVDPESIGVGQYQHDVDRSAKGATAASHEELHAVMFRDARGEVLKVSETGDAKALCCKTAEGLLVCIDSNTSYPISGELCAPLLVGKFWRSVCAAIRIRSLRA
jgi:hypothetical protein